MVFRPQSEESEGADGRVTAASAQVYIYFYLFICIYLYLLFTYINLFIHLLDLIISNYIFQASEENAQIFVMNNYFGIGLDADLCYAFHTEREHKPHKFNSRLHNKGVYFKVGLQKMVGRGLNKDLKKEIILEVDGKPVDLPSVKGIIILNIMR